MKQNVRCAIKWLTESDIKNKDKNRASFRGSIMATIGCLTKCKMKTVHS